MEDRHSFSDARPVYGSEIPTWEVDVFRAGVKEPVFTLLINKMTLPPRVGKKKKIVWKLPESQNVKPNFAAAEKSRLFDLFKEQKKSRRRKSKRQSMTTTSSSNPAEDDSSGGGSSADLCASPPGSPTGVATPRPPKTVDTSVEIPMAPLPPPGMGAPHQKVETQLPPPPPPLTTTTSTTDSSSSSIESTNRNTGQSKELREPLAPSLLSRPTDTEKAEVDTSPAPPPPGFSTVSSSSLAADVETRQKYFCLPSTSSQQKADLAQLFMDVYYSSLTHKEDSVLADYYAEGAQKSLSVGAAHAYCAGPEIAVQLQLLQESLWDVRGVVTQDGLLGSVVLLITGTSLPKGTRTPLPFCHTVTLIRVPDLGYQIYNDALSLLSDGAA